MREVGCFLRAGHKLFYLKKLLKQKLEDYVLQIKWSLFQEKFMNIKCDVIVYACLGKLVDRDCEVGIVLFTQTMPAVKLYPVQVFVSVYQGVESGVINKDIIDVSVTAFFIQSSPDAFEDLP